MEPATAACSQADFHPYMSMSCIECGHQPGPASARERIANAIRAAATADDWANERYFSMLEDRDRWRLRYMDCSSRLTRFRWLTLGVSILAVIGWSRTLGSATSQPTGR